MATSGVRLARTSDVDDIAAVNVRAWQTRLAGLVPPDVLAALEPADLAMIWARSILNPPLPGQRLLVSVDDDQVVGYAAFGPSQDPDADASTVELISLEIDPGRERQGHASRLMSAVIDHARSEQMHSASTWCPVHDEPRRAFLQSAGWGPDSAYRDVEVGIDENEEPMLLREVRLVTDIS